MRTTTRAPRTQSTQRERQTHLAHLAHLAQHIQQVLVVAADSRLGALVTAGLAPRGWRVTAVPPGAAALTAAVLERPHLIVLQAGNNGSAADGVPAADQAFLRAYQELPPPHAPVLLVIDGPDPLRASQSPQSFQSSQWSHWSHAGARNATGRLDGAAAARDRALGVAASLTRPFALLRLLDLVDQHAPRRPQHVYARAGAPTRNEVP
jgi:hypothetical protein